MAPKIGPLAPLQIKVGQMINFDVDVEGEPPAEVSWFYPSGQEIHHGGKVKLENEDYRSKLQIRSTEREHSGTYRIRAVNENGEDSVQVEVTVVGKWKSY